MKNSDVKIGDIVYLNNRKFMVEGHGNNDDLWVIDCISCRFDKDMLSEYKLVEKDDGYYMFKK